MNREVPVVVSDSLLQAMAELGLSVQELVESAIAEALAKKLPILALTPRARTVLQLANKNALEAGQAHIGTEHILLGLLDDWEGVAAQILDELGVAVATRERIQEILRSPGYARSSTTRPTDAEMALIQKWRDERAPRRMTRQQKPRKTSSEDAANGNL